MVCETSLEGQGMALWAQKGKILTFLYTKKKPRALALPKLSYAIP